MIRDEMAGEEKSMVSKYHSAQKGCVSGREVEKKASRNKTW
jgi:hypothetical protein